MLQEFGSRRKGNTRQHFGRQDAPKMDASALISEGMPNEGAYLTTAQRALYAQE